MQMTSEIRKGDRKERHKLEERNNDDKEEFICESEEGHCLRLLSRCLKPKEDIKQRKNSRIKALRIIGAF